VVGLDPFDPLGKLPTMTAPSGTAWSTTSLQTFWTVLTANHIASPLPTGYPYGYPFDINSSTTPPTWTTRNVLPTLVSAGPNKLFGTDLLGSLGAGTDDDAKDNILSFRLRREGNRGN
jgi:hypothetical protein